MATLRPDPTFYPSPRMAMKAPAETLAYVVAFDPKGKNSDQMTVVDVDPKSKQYAKIVGKTDMPNAGDELHHFGWNACSSCFVRTRRIRTPSAAIWWCRVCAPRACTFWTSSRIQSSRRS